MRYKNKIEFPMFKTTLLVVVGTKEEILEEIGKYEFSSEEKREKKLKLISEHFSDNYKPEVRAAGVCGPIEGGDYVIAVNIAYKELESNWKKGICNVIPHEIRHYVDRITENCGIKDRETPAYLTGYITETILPDLL